MIIGRELLGQIKNIVIVAGCQRSGTTLVGNMLGCHRQAFLIDEDEGLYGWVEKCLFSDVQDDILTQNVFAAADHKYKFDHKRIKVFQGKRKLSPEIDTLVLKGPNLTYHFKELSQLKYNVQIVYPVRDPRAVVTSMDRLNHIDMVGNQIKRIESNAELTEMFSKELKLFQNSNLSKHQRRALVWKIKSGLYSEFQAAGLNCYV